MGKDEDFSLKNNITTDSMDVEIIKKKNENEEEEEEKEKETPQIQGHHVFSAPTQKQSDITKNKNKQSLLVKIGRATAFNNPATPNDTIAPYIVLRLNKGKGTPANSSTLPKSNQGEWNETFKLASEKYDMNFLKLTLAFCQYHRIVADETLAQFEYDLSTLEKDSDTPVFFELPGGGRLELVLTACGFGLNEQERSRRSRLQQEAVLLQNAKGNKLEHKMQKKDAKREVKRAKLEGKQVEKELKTIKKSKKQILVVNNGETSTLTTTTTSTSTSTTTSGEGKDLPLEKSMDIAPAANDDLERRENELLEEKRKRKEKMKEAEKKAKALKKAEKKEKKLSKSIKKEMKKDSL